MTKADSSLRSEWPYYLIVGAEREIPHCVRNDSVSNYVGMGKNSGEAAVFSHPSPPANARHFDWKEKSPQKYVICTEGRNLLLRRSSTWITPCKPLPERRSSGSGNPPASELRRSSTTSFGYYVELLRSSGGEGMLFPELRFPFDCAQGTPSTALRERSLGVIQVCLLRRH